MQPAILCCTIIHDSVVASGSKEYFLLDTGSTQSYLKVPELVQAVISGEGNDTQYGKILSFACMLSQYDAVALQLNNQI